MAFFRQRGGTGNIMIQTSFILKLPGIHSHFAITPDQIKLSHDSRTMKQGEAFIALSAETHDAYNFIADVQKKNPSFVIINKKNEKDFVKNFPKASFIVVESTNDFFIKLSMELLKKWRTGNHQRKVIGITGSNGKTTTKEMLFHILNSVWPNKIHKNHKNFNNQFGVCYTLLELNESHEILIMEIGTNHPGEIKSLSEMIDADFGMITSIGDSHLEFFKNRENVFVEKKELFLSIKKRNGKFLVNNNDPFLKSLANEPCSISLSQYLKTIESDSLVFKDDLQLSNPHLIGTHNYEDLALAIVCAHLITDISIEKLKPAAMTFKPGMNRSEWIEKNGIKILMDCYNANPSSMEASLMAFLNYLEKNKIDSKETLLVIGDMNELGETGPDLHQKIGKLLNRFQNGQIVFVGKFQKYYELGLGRSPNSMQKTAMNHLDLDYYKKSKIKYIFIKGSRSLQLESLIAI
jgi:UDP-N-acetylmuramoyl-tripeptide--D-alanyl-D-alanine ligase